MTLPGLIDTPLHSCYPEGFCYDCPWRGDKGSWHSNIFSGFNPWPDLWHYIYCFVQSREVYTVKGHKQTHTYTHTHTHTHTHRSTIFLTTSTWNARKLRFYVFLHFHDTKHVISLVDPLHKKFWVLFQFSLGTRGPIIGTKRNACTLRSLGFSV